MKVWWHSMQVRQIQLSSLDQNRQETGVSWHANPWLIRSTRTAGVSKHPSHPIRQVNPFHLHVFKLFFLSFFFPQDSITYMLHVVAMTDWDRRSMSSRLSEHMWEADRVESWEQIRLFKVTGLNRAKLWKQMCRCKLLRVHCWNEVQFAARNKCALSLLSVVYSWCYSKDVGMFY